MTGSTGNAPTPPPTPPGPPGQSGQNGQGGQLRYSPELVQATVDAVKRSAQSPDLRTALGSAQGVEAFARSSQRGVGCVALEVKNGQVCLDLPLFFPDICIPVPVSFIPDGTSVEACIDICFGGFLGVVPKGVCVTVTALGQRIAHECIGSCS